MCVCVLWLCVFGSVPDIQIGVGMYSFVRLSVVYIIYPILCVSEWAGAAVLGEKCVKV